MEKYVYIIQQIKKAHFKGWDDEVLRECVDMLPSLTDNIGINVPLVSETNVPPLAERNVPLVSD